MGTLVWGASNKDKASLVRVEKAFAAIVSAAQFHSVRVIKSSRSPKPSTPAV